MRRTGSRTRLLVTGFGPFPGTPDNPSERLVRMIASDAVRIPPGVAVSTEVLPTSWSDVARMTPDLLARRDPDIILHFGHSARAHGFCLEQVARNRAAPMKDVDGCLPPKRCIDASAPRLLRTGLPVRNILLRLRALRLPSALSQDAGNYLCNTIYYLSLAYAKHASRRVDSLFVHIPHTDIFPQEDALTTGAAAIIDACVKVRRQGGVKVA